MAWTLTDIFGGRTGNPLRIFLFPKGRGWAVAKWRPVASTKGRQLHCTGSAGPGTTAGDGRKNADILIALAKL